MFRLHKMLWEEKRARGHAGLLFHLGLVAINIFNSNAVSFNNTQYHNNSEIYLATWLHNQFGLSAVLILL